LRPPRDRGRLPHAVVADPVAPLVVVVEIVDVDPLAFVVHLVHPVVLPGRGAEQVVFRLVVRLNVLLRLDAAVLVPRAGVGLPAELLLCDLDLLALLRDGLRFGPDPADIPVVGDFHGNLREAAWRRAAGLLDRHRDGRPPADAAGGRQGVHRRRPHRTDPERAAPPTTPLTKRRRPDSAGYLSD